MNKQQFYDIIMEIREVVSDPEKVKCTCPNTYCEWYGKCKECVAQHRHFGQHVPTCLQPILKSKIEALADTAELHTAQKERTTLEYWQYVHEMDEAVEKE